MEIVNAVIHYLEKKDDGSDTVLQTPNEALTLSDSLGFLLNKLIHVFNQKPEKRFGAINTEAAVSTFGKNLEQYVAESTEFMDLSQTLAEDIKEIFCESQFAGNAYVLSIHYKQGMGDFYLLTILHATDAVSVTKVLQLASQKPLDLTNMQLAMRININEWKKKSGSKHSVSYAKGRMNAKLVEDVMSFLGFSEEADPVEDTKVLMQAVEAFCKNEDMDAEAAQALKKNTVDYCTDQSKSGEPVFVHELSEQISQEDPDRFLAFASEGSQALAREFHPDRKSLRKLIRYSGSDKQMSISFVSELMGSKIHYDEEKDTLTIEGIPSSLKAQLVGTLE